MWCFFYCRCDVSCCRCYVSLVVDMMSGFFLKQLICVMLQSYLSWCNPSSSLYCLGGLTAVIWTDFFQTILMLVGSSVLMVISEYTMYTVHRCIRITMYVFTSESFYVSMCMCLNLCHNMCPFMSVFLYLCHHVCLYFCPCVCLHLYHALCICLMCFCLYLCVLHLCQCVSAYLYLQVCLYLCHCVYLQLGCTV